MTIRLAHAAKTAGLMASLCLGSAVLSACGEAKPDTDAAAAEAASTEAADASPAAAAPAAASEPAAPASSGAPAFAVLYPGAEADNPATLGANGADRGGMIDFTTDASAEQVVAFYKARAAASGLETKVSMNQEGGVENYAAGHPSNGAMLTVVATPVDGRTSVNLSWSAGS